MSSKAFQLHIFFLRFLSIVGYYKILNIVLCVCCSTVSDSCGSMDCSPPGSSNGVSQARVLEWGAISYSEGYSSAFQGLNSHLLHLLRWQADSSPLAPPGTVLLPGKSHGRRSLKSLGSITVGDDWATSLSLSCTGEGNGNPLQCSCLENPRGGEAWWAAVYGVAQSWTRLTWLSSSSSSHLGSPMLSCAISKSMLLICSVYSGVHLLTPYS